MESPPKRVSKAEVPELGSLRGPGRLAATEGRSEGTTRPRATNGPKESKQGDRMSLLKRALFERLLGLEWSVFVYLDPRAPEVVVPSEHKKNAVLLLEIGLNMPVHIPLDVDEDGFVATLSFNRVPFKCEVPWTRVFALVGKSDKRGRVFEEDVPVEVRAVQLRGFGDDDGVVVAPVARSEDHQDEKKAVGAPAPFRGLKLLKGGKS